MSNSQDRAANSSIFPVVLIIHANASMYGTPIRNINESLDKFFKELQLNESVKSNAEVSVISITDKTTLLQDWKTVNDEPFMLTNIYAEGGADLTDAFSMAIKLIDERMEKHASENTTCHKPAIILISDCFSISDSNVEAEVTTRIADDKFDLFLLLVDNDTAPAICCEKNAYTLDSTSPYDFSGFFRLMEAMILNTVATPVGIIINHSNLIDDVWENIPVKKIESFLT